MGMADEKQQPGPLQAGEVETSGDEFALRTKRTKWAGRDIVMIEPSLADGVQLADFYFDVLMETVGGKSVTRLRIRESEYIVTVCAKYIKPAIDATALPLRLYRDVRQLIDEWEDWSGMRALRETMQSQISEGD